MKALGQGSNYKSSLLSHLDHVKNLSTKIDQEARILSQERLKKLYDHLQREDQRTRDLLENTLKQHQTLTDEKMMRLANCVLNSWHLQFSSEGGSRNNGGTRMVHYFYCDECIGADLLIQ